MMKVFFSQAILSIVAVLFLQIVYAQQHQLTLSDAIRTGLNNYQSIQAKR
ncbi:MAG: hypothetical protein JST96_14645, partial [Bacteroidetes bacterium]|nr:hypothetical protein [Bacteroidota bacterium]